MPDTPVSPQQLHTLQKMIYAGGPVCVFTGAGFSCPSGIPDFRSAGGIFSQHDGAEHSPEEMVSRPFFDAHPAAFFDFYKSRMVWPGAQPNAAHRWVAALEAQGVPVTVITQNIDGLHQAAGSSHVLELHGSVHRNRCMRCHAPYSLQAVLDAQAVPRCPACGGVIKPEVVLYGEALDDAVVTAAVQALQTAATLLVAGTSLAVYPAASFLQFFGGEHLAVINLSPTHIDRAAGLAIYADVAAVAEGMLALGPL